MALTAASRIEANKIVTTFETTNLNNLGFAKYQASNEQGDDLEDDEKDTSNRVSLEETLKLKYRLKEKLICRLVSDITPPVIRKKKCRLIIRNLSFQATLQNVIDKMKKFGPIVEVEIPTESVEVKPRKGKTNDSGDSPAIKEKKKGYAFVTYLCEKDAKSAVTNSTGLRICNREIAIDMCLSKGAFEKYGRKTDGADEGKEEDSESNEVEDEGDDGEPGEANANTDNNELAPSESNKDNNPSDQRKLMDDTKEGKTIFVYGLSYDTNSNDLQEFFSKYGKIEMALIVKDKTTGISKGSAFVKFASKDSVAMIFDDIAAKNKGVTGSNSKMLEINNRNCYINVAMNKEDLSVMKSSSKVGKDKRNLYLANEGIMVNNLNDDSISKYDKEKRIQSQVDKKKKLQNPIFFISENRLSIRNLSKKLSNNELKIACLKAVKNGISNNLVGVNDIKNFAVAQGIASLKKLYPGRDFGDSENQSSLDSSLVDVNSLQVPAFDAKNCVKQVKIMYDEKKIRDGKPQSRGYAFVEFSNHIYALAALRDLNNNPKYESISISNDDKEQKGRLIAEFTVENLRKVLGLFAHYLSYIYSYV
jgi:nucleolar protein 4